MRFSVALLAVLALGCRTQAPTDRAPETPRAALLVASDLDNAPFAYVDADGTPRGRDVEMMEQLAERLARPLVWKRMPFEELLERLEANEVDVVCATLGVTPERSQRVLFSRPYFDTHIRCVVRRGAGEPTTLEDLAGRPVTAARGTTSESALRRELPWAVPRLENKSGRTTLERLTLGEVDAALMDGPAALALVDREPERLACLAAPVATERYALALPKGHAGLQRDLDRELDSMASTGRLSELDRKHGLRGSGAPSFKAGP